MHWEIRPFRTSEPVLPMFWPGLLVAIVPVCGLHGRNSGRWCLSPGDAYAVAVGGDILFFVSGQVGAVAECPIGAVSSL
jgi:hypothetical protein